MNEILQKYKNLHLPGQLVVIQLFIWLLTQIGRLIHFQWEAYFALDSRIGELLFKPWTLFTYMWVHANIGDDLFHIIFNMMWLWYFGQFFLRYHTSKQLLHVFIWGGIIGGLSFLLWGSCMNDTFGQFLVGASGAIFALVAAVAIRQPNEPIYLNLFVRIVPISMKWFALIALGINIMHLLGGQNSGGIICHLGGMLWGALYELNLLKGWTKQLFSPKVHMAATPGGKRTPHPDKQKDIDYNQRQKEQQARIDAILDKISRSGYDGLTAEEKAALFDASQRKKSNKI